MGECFYGQVFFIKARTLGLPTNEMLEEMKHFASVCRCSNHTGSTVIMNIDSKITESTGT